MDTEDRRPLPGDTVRLTEISPGLLDGLPQEDQRAIGEPVGKPLVLGEYRDDGAAELELTDSAGHRHYVYADRTFVRST
jgi:hypothetical protein